MIQNILLVLVLLPIALFIWMVLVGLIIAITIGLLPEEEESITSQLPQEIQEWIERVLFELDKPENQSQNYRDIALSTVKRDIVIKHLWPYLSLPKEDIVQIGMAGWYQIYAKSEFAKKAAEAIRWQIDDKYFSDPISLPKQEDTTPIEKIDIQWLEELLYQSDTKWADIPSAILVIANTVNSLISKQKDKPIEKSIPITHQEWASLVALVSESAWFNHEEKALQNAVKIIHKVNEKRVDLSSNP